MTPVYSVAIVILNVNLAQILEQGKEIGHKNGLLYWNLL